MASLVKYRQLFLTLFLLALVAMVLGHPASPRDTDLSEWSLKIGYVSDDIPNKKPDQSEEQTLRQVNAGTFGKKSPFENPLHSKRNLPQTLRKLSGLDKPRHREKEYPIFPRHFENSDFNTQTSNAATVDMVDIEQTDRVDYDILKRLLGMSVAEKSKSDDPVEDLVNQSAKNIPTSFPGEDSFYETGFVESDGEIGSNVVVDDFQGEVIHQNGTDNGHKDGRRPRDRLSDQSIDTRMVNNAAGDDHNDGNVKTNANGDDVSRNRYPRPRQHQHHPIDSTRGNTPKDAGSVVFGTHVQRSDQHFDGSHHHGHDVIDSPDDGIGANDERNNDGGEMVDSAEGQLSHNVGLHESLKRTENRHNNNNDKTDNVNSVVSSNSDSLPNSDLDDSSRHSHDGHSRRKHSSKSSRSSDSDSVSGGESSGRFSRSSGESDENTTTSKSTSTETTASIRTDSDTTSKTARTDVAVTSEPTSTRTIITTTSATTTRAPYARVHIGVGDLSKLRTLMGSLSSLSNGKKRDLIRLIRCVQSKTSCSQSVTINGTTYHTGTLKQTDQRVGGNFD